MDLVLAGMGLGLDVYFFTPAGGAKRSLFILYVDSFVMGVDGVNS